MNVTNPRLNERKSRTRRAVDALDECLNHRENWILACAIWVTVWGGAILLAMPYVDAYMSGR